MSEKEKRGCFRTGLFGCLALLGLVLMLAGGLAGMAVLDSRRDTEMVQEERSAAVPVQRRARPATAEELADARTASPLPTFPDRELPVRGAGTLELDLEMGEFTLVPSDGEEIEIEGDFDQARFRLEGVMVEDDDGTWRYRVRFGNRSRLLFATSNVRNRITIRVPRDVPVSVVGKVRMGTSAIELGGLWVRDVDLEMGMGEHRISFSEPTPEPMGAFEARGSMGQLEVIDLGNASPRTVAVTHGMGELGLGLEGAWRNDCEVRARWRMGQLTVETAEDVRVEVGSSLVLFGGKSVRLGNRDHLPADAAVLRLDLGGSMGEVVVR
ncbi:MAG TPA: hypothetical protein VMV46_17410 [Thermoanaerobaculia bacterium]|nr:hypothetical protein [Thermoanaerobaculia bacterium]